MDRLLVTGGSGMLGSNVAYLSRDRFATRFTFRSHPVSIPKCSGIKVDLQDCIAVKRAIETYRPNLIIHTAALLPAKLCEDDPVLARGINTDGVRHVCGAAKEIGAKLIHISTDWVFDGAAERYSEEDRTDPINEYGRSKLEGEQIIQESGVNYCIVRTSIYGWNLRPGKLCYLETALETVRKDEEFPAPMDQYFAPILVNSLAEALFEIYEKDISGVLHVTGSEACSRYEFCRTAAEVFGLRPDLVRPVVLSDKYFGVQVPRHQTLDITKAKSLLATRLPGNWEGLVAMRELWDNGYVSRLRGVEQ